MTIAMLRRSGAASSQPTQSGANHAAPASRATIPIEPRRRMIVIASPAASSERPATTSAARASPEPPAYVVGGSAGCGTRSTVVTPSCQSQQTHAHPQYAGEEATADRGCLHRPILPPAGRRRPRASLFERDLAWIRVPPPGGLSMRSLPPTASILSASPRRPKPRAGSAPPTPSSATSTSSRLSRPGRSGSRPARPTHASRCSRAPPSTGSRRWPPRLTRPARTRARGRQAPDSDLQGL